MADNLRYNEPGAGPVLRTVDRSSVHYPVTHLAGGAGTELIDGTTANGLEVDLTRIQSAVSSNNSSTATLGNGGVFTGTGDEVLNYSEVCVNVIASHASATDGVSLQWSSDNSNWDMVETWTLVANVALVIRAAPKARYFRVVFTNGGTTQTTFRLQTVYKSISSGVPTVENGRILVDGLSREVKFSKINATANGDNTVVGAVTGKRLRVLTIWHTQDDNKTVTYKSGASNTLIDAESFAKYGGLGINGQPAAFVLQTNAGEAFVMNLSGAMVVRGGLTYVELPG